MREADMPAFLELFDGVATLLQKPGHPPIGAAAKAMFFRALAAYPLAQVRAGFDAHVRDPQRGRFLPTPADVIAQIEGLAAEDGRPGAEEAWATALRCADEAETVVWTQEMAQAWAIARPILEARDEVGARMAFREAYGRLVDEARRKRIPAAWSASLGFDKERQVLAIEQAVQAGRLPQSERLALSAPADMLQLGYYDQPGPKASAAEIEARAKLRALADDIKAGKLAPPSVDAQERARTDELKAEQAQRARAYAERTGLSLDAAPVHPESETQQ